MRKQRNIGFCIWMDERDRKSYCIGVYTSPRKFAAPLLSLLHANEDELRERLGANFRLDDANQDYPIWEHISKDDPEAVAKRLLIYRDTFVPYIDKILPPKETVK